MQLFVHRMNQTAHISLQILSISNSVETKSTGCALSLVARPASVASVFVAVLANLLSHISPSSAPSCASAPPVRGYLRMGVGVRKAFFAGKRTFCIIPGFFHIFRHLRQYLVSAVASPRNICTRCGPPGHQILWLSPHYPQRTAE